MSKENGLYNIEIGGKTFEFIVNYKCIKALDELHKDGLYDIFVTKVSLLKAPVSLIVKIYHASMTSMGDKRFTEDEVGEMVMKDGLMVHAKRCMDYITFVMKSGEIESDVPQKK